MGIISSRLNIEGLSNSNGGGSNVGRRRRRSQQDETIYSYSLSKNYFSNYFLMNGERFEVNDPDYLFGENCDLNFLSCIKPYYFPYKQAQQDLLNSLANSKQQKSGNKASNRVAGRFSLSINNLLGRNDVGGGGGGRNGQRRGTQSSTNDITSGNGRSDSISSNDNALKHDAQTQTLNGSKGFGKNESGTPLAQPLVMFVNVRKETLRLVKLSNVCNLDSDLNSLTNYPASSSSQKHPNSSNKDIVPSGSSFRLIKNRRQPSSLSKHSRTSVSQLQQNRLSASSSRATTSNVYQDEVAQYTYNDEEDDVTCHLGSSHTKDDESEGSSLLSASSSTKSGYASVREDRANSVTIIMDNKTCNDISSTSSDDDEKFVDALNDPANLSTSYELDDLDKNQQQARSLLSKDRTTTKSTTKENRDIKITIEPMVTNDRSATNNTSDIKKQPVLAKIDSNMVIATEKCQGDETLTEYSLTSREVNSRSKELDTKAANKRLTMTEETTLSSKPPESSGSHRVYNIEFYFDAEVDCSIRIFYFCTRETTSTGISYKPQHATYKSKVYNYKKGLNQKFDQQEHTFQPYLFDEDLLIYKPLDLQGNYNSGAVFPIVIHIVALDGPTPRQSQSLVATIEKSQLDDSYSIKPLKQLIFVDGVQYILQDIYGIEHKQIPTTQPAAQITGSMTDSNTSNVTKTSTIVECVICMSDERDTILLPCRHLCLCSSCAQSLRHQSSSCPICRCPFKAALNLQYES